MLIKVAWRNIWRNKVRSLVVIVAITLGLWAGIFVSAFVNGMMQQKIDSVIQLEMAHFQIHQNGFRDEYLVGQYLDEGFKIWEELQKDKEVKAVASRTVSLVMIGTAQKSGAVKVSGISASEEKNLSNLHQRIVEGKYLDEKTKNSILISREIAIKYKVGLKSKIILTFQDIHGEIVGAAFRVIGIYSTENKMYDGLNVFVRREDMQHLTGIGNKVHELAVLLNDHEPADLMATKYGKKYPTLEVLSWKDLAGGMRYMTGIMDKYTMIIVGIILLALLFSIINTMMMAVLERAREIGMLMAVGMGKMKIFNMILLETVFLCSIGGPVGILLAWLSVYYFRLNGIDLGNAAYGDWGFSNFIYPTLAFEEYVKVSFLVIAMALLAAVYPARKALKLNPVEAIRKI